MPSETEQKDRANWLGILARARRADIEAVWPAHADPLEFEWLRKPQPGLVMVRGRAGGTGNAFNLGEMTVTRCALRLADGTVGQGYVQGRDRKHSELAARLDALLQLEAHRDGLLAQVIEPLRRTEEERRLERSRKAASTKVEFFTLVRGANPT
ncbi:MAG TPA: phosphonate C-P lyase system protein PhnG [Devosiaceae bacterium]|nr:phosphonate C-P lyase system protein PhnG [Devosiaceae bacterium]